MGPDCDNASQEEAMSIVADRSEAPVLEAAERLLTVEEAAKVLRVTAKWLYERTRRNAISHHRFGKYIRFTKSDLHQIIVRGSCGPQNIK